jgi:hypothetical protein
MALFLLRSTVKDLSKHHRFDALQAIRHKYPDGSLLPEGRNISGLEWDGIHLAALLICLGVKD